MLTAIQIVHELYILLLEAEYRVEAAPDGRRLELIREVRRSLDAFRDARWR